MSEDKNTLYCPLLLDSDAISDPTVDFKADANENRKTGAKHSPVSPERWPSNGGINKCCIFIVGVEGRTARRELF